METNVPPQDDHISDLPGIIIGIILKKLPIRDVVRTSVLSTKWRYKWTTLTELEFNDTCVSHTYGALAENSLVTFVNQFLLLHNGPINRFTLSSSYMRNSPYVYQWLLFLSRKDLQELNFRLGEGEWFTAPSCLFSCNKLIGLELVRCVLNPPLNFKGFPHLNSLNLQRVDIEPDALENLISSCTLLETLALSYSESAALTIRAPNLKYLLLGGSFKCICLENSPMLVVMSVTMYTADDTDEDSDTDEHSDQISSTNFDKLLGGVPSIQKLVGRSYFTKYLSIGNTLREIQPAYRHLKVIELYEVSFDDISEIMVILQLILNAPNLQVLQIEASSFEIDPPDMDFWDREPRYATLEHLKVVNLIQIVGLPHEMKFIEFLLGSSPALEVMVISQGVRDAFEKEDMLKEILEFPRASAAMELIFEQV